MISERYSVEKQGMELADNSRIVLVPDEVRYNNREVCEAMDSVSRLTPEGFNKLCELLPERVQQYSPPVERKVVDLKGFTRRAGDISDFDFVVDFRRPDGSIVTVLIPDVQPDHYSRVGQADAQQEPYGLNLVCRGHYT